MLLPTSLLTFLHLALPALCHASPQPPLITTDWEQSLVPRHTLFLRQVSDLQTFTSALGGTKASPITNSGDAKRPFKVDGDTFTDFETAAQRSCDNHNNGNNNNDNKDKLTVNQCDEQKNKCNAAQKSAPVKDFNSAVASTNIGPDPDFPDFDLICEG
ncbi:hypothetical protein Alg130_02880 [Pyrenophora tritici-repentis]|uniref:Uncharacterized protein n=1 Tax=Pyrenophora tritici-repentis TaxID=45151 RepID=A0A5M9L804_9PLEO|nr:hypothetical protein PtrV1_06580 [Pyrenophora tritici-repentis]KAF7571319.1 hypothetical protein PtrM4_088190 [Pyrenophora tritici-repentis]KAI0574564.1 hypothetical protein Alg215_08533 [Pyrenophora tritici-repentis]KAI0589571.1 hypothetical protein Alg130_02880 [Pyrenophora tritici-repentis]KAI1532082.1 hypothetical protein PtrSN001C_008089 [Pyrenophora tritici-repentis]